MLKIVLRDWHPEVKDIIFTIHNENHPIFDEMAVKFNGNIYVYQETDDVKENVSVFYRLSGDIHDISYLTPDP